MTARAPADTLTRPKGDLVRAAARALAILDVLAAYPGGVTPKAIAVELGLNVSTVYHLLNTLVANEHAIRAPGSRLFFLGARVAQLHASLIHALQVPPSLRDVTDALRRATGDTTGLSQWWGEEVLVSVLCEGTREDHVTGGYVGLTGPAQLLASGKVLLAWAPTTSVEAYLARGHVGPFEQLARIALPDVRAELATIRRAGCAVDRDPTCGGVCCVAAPVMSAAGRVEHALSVSVPTHRFAAAEATLVETVLGIARAASAALQADAAPPNSGAPGRRAGTAPLLPRLS